LICKVPRPQYYYDYNLWIDQWWNGSTKPREYNWGATWKNSSGSGLENRDHGRGDPLHWSCNTLYPQKLALTSPTSGGRSVSIVPSRTKAVEFFTIEQSKLLFWRFR
jgi:hypothetical protein